MINIYVGGIFSAKNICVGRISCAATYAQYEKPCTISMSTWPLRGDNFSRFLTDKRWFPVSKVPNDILGAPDAANF